ncbi:MAG TPA: thiamine phosphate synthase [Candidatus Kapabacteria bacterium]|jgi:thiamine-phosphate pyrophosphorylase
MKSLEGLHAIIGGASFERTLELARIADDEGAAVIQLREKSLPTAELLRMADAVRNVVHRAAFLVNDRADIAFAVGADGVHLGQDDLPAEVARKILGPNAIIGMSAPNVELAREAERNGVNYIGFGHMFPTNSKVKLSPPQSIDALQAVIDAIQIPVVIIGGIGMENIAQILVPNLGGVAIIRAIRDAVNPRETIRMLVRTLEDHHAYT